MGRVSYGAGVQLRALFVASRGINDISVKGGFMDVRRLRGHSQDLYLRSGGIGAALRVQQSTFLHISLANLRLSGRKSIRSGRNT